MSDKKEIGYAVLVNSEEYGTMLGLGDIVDFATTYPNFLVFGTKEEADEERERAEEESDAEEGYTFTTVRLYAEPV